MITQKDVATAETSLTDEFGRTIFYNDNNQNHVKLKEQYLKACEAKNEEILSLIEYLNAGASNKTIQDIYVDFYQEYNGIKFKELTNEIKNK